ncbi:hypothetical protein [Hufsiella ginkgonis]|uniref:Uncharacterized protein n=1 Tax=Hufsiella ginkgonis TaxID=2695274 RepID=A0A7K1XZZ9_9SPHI|nr:hypothetical protein [Hufsiella ginkgonis]MXV16319.1 hypothetical protein [Hufsiella ginkgonis]
MEEENKFIRFVAFILPRRTGSSWTETGSDIGSHKEGHEALTPDQVYRKAKKRWMKMSVEENEICFEAKNDGMISAAGTFPGIARTIASPASHRLYKSW